MEYIFSILVIAGAVFALLSLFVIGWGINIVRKGRKGQDKHSQRKELDG